MMAAHADSTQAGLTSGANETVTQGADATLPSASLDILNLGHGTSLRFEGESLVVKDKSIAKKGRSNFCGVPLGGGASELRIPFYNVLWAEVADDKITIDYADETTKLIQADKIAYPLADIPSKQAENWAESLLEHAYGPAQRCRRAKVLVNPHAGPGGAVKIWTQQVEPLFKAARMILDVEHTKSVGAAIDISERLDIDKYDIIVPCSGDGLPHEIFNGLGKRSDARRALRQLAVAPIPCGSGNGISCNLNGSHKPDIAALAVIKGVRTPMDLVSVTQGDKRTLSFLSQSVGIIAHCDLGTEHLRWMGPARFDYGVAKGAFTHLSVPLTLSVKTQVASKDEIKTIFAKEKLEQSKEGFAATREQVAIRTPGEKSDELPPLVYGTVNDKLPEDWVTTKHEKMGNFYCGNMCWMAPKVNFFPAASANDGLMDLVMNRSDIPIVQYAEMLLGIDSGTFFNRPCLEYSKIVAYRLTPHQESGYISIDGEKVPFRPFQCEVHPGLATVISKRGRYETPGPMGWEKFSGAAEGAS